MHASNKQYLVFFIVCDMDMLRMGDFQVSIYTHTHIHAHANAHTIQHKIIIWKKVIFQMTYA